MILYPTQEEIEKADHRELAYWSRYLPSPGSNHLDSHNLRAKMEEEVVLMNSILKKFKEFGGWNSEISKSIDRR